MDVATHRYVRNMYLCGLFEPSNIELVERNKQIENHTGILQVYLQKILNFCCCCYYRNLNAIHKKGRGKGIHRYNVAESV